MQKTLEALGDPDLSLSGLSVWLQGRQFPDASDYWDGNWLNTAALCQAHGASVLATGPILHIPELIAWREELRSLLASLSGTAELKPMEPQLHVSLTAEALGHLALVVSITPDHLTQRHEFRFAIDQSFIPPLLQQLDRALVEYPVKGSP